MFFRKNFIGWNPRKFSLVIFSVYAILSSMKQLKLLLQLYPLCCQGTSGNLPSFHSELHDHEVSWDQTEMVLLLIDPVLLTVWKQNNVNRYGHHI